MPVRRTITFVGNVQGVFFRATTHDIATQQFAGRVTGFVQNMPDGSVLCVAEGEPQELDRFVEAVERAKHKNIREVHVVQSAATSEFSSFQIQR